MSENETARPYPVRVGGELDASLSRWLWLVKWLLVIPHVIVLAFLWAALCVMSVVAFFAILIAGRYPRAIFDFNVGVLRWTWRVAYYSYGALGTDRYPPFTLEPVPSYPATLEVDYPERLSRGLVLVKWWLLAIPHLAIVAVLLGGGGWFVWWTDRPWGPGLIFVLVVIAAVALLFTGRYLQGIFDFVLGLDRWVLRVAAYVGLMRDEYPPFRLDAGGADPGKAAEPVPEAEAEVSPEPAQRWSAGRVIAVVIGSILALVAVAVFALGAAGVIFDQVQRDADGFLMSPTERFSTGTYAIVSESIDVDVDTPDWVVDELIGKVRIRGESDEPLFLGVAPAADANPYLRGVGHAVVTGFTLHPDYSTKPGAAPSSAPGEQAFWVASASGAGEQVLDWEVEDGDWVIAAMNQDGSRGIDADLSIGAELDWVLWLGIGFLAAGVLLGALAAAIIYAGIPKHRT